MKTIARYVVAIVGNGIGFLAAAYWIPGFVVTKDLKQLFILFCLLICSTPLLAQELERHPAETQSPEVLEETVPIYPLSYPLIFNLEAAAQNSWSLFLLSEEGMHRLLSKTSGIGTYLAATAWQFFAIYNITLWPHEAGHYLRGREFGIHWRITDFKFPKPGGTDDFSASGISNKNITMLNLGGIEMNHLMALHAQKRIYRLI